MASTRAAWRSRDMAFRRMRSLVPHAFTSDGGSLVPLWLASSDLADTETENMAEAGKLLRRMRPGFGELRDAVSATAGRPVFALAPLTPHRVERARTALEALCKAYDEAAAAIRDYNECAPEPDLRVYVSYPDGREVASDGWRVSFHFWVRNQAPGVARSADLMATLEIAVGLLPPVADVDSFKVRTDVWKKFLKRRRRQIASELGDTEQRKLTASP